MSAQKQSRWSILLVWNLEVLFPVCTKIGERTEALNQSMIPGLKLVQDIAVLSDLLETPPVVEKFDVLAARLPG